MPVLSFRPQYGANKTNACNRSTKLVMQALLFMLSSYYLYKKINKKNIQLCLET